MKACSECDKVFDDKEFVDWRHGVEYTFKRCSSCRRHFGQLNRSERVRARQRPFKVLRSYLEGNWLVYVLPAQCLS